VGHGTKHPFVRIIINAAMDNRGLYANWTDHPEPTLGPNCRSEVVTVRVFRFQIPTVAVEAAYFQLKTAEHTFIPNTRSATEGENVATIATPSL
jgi:hypothetical protein